MERKLHHLRAVLPKISLENALQESRFSVFLYGREERFNLSAQKSIAIMEHPDDQQLQLFVSARLDTKQEKTIEQHLAECPQCSSRVSELERSPEDPLLQKIKAAAENVDDETRPPDMKELVRKLGGTSPDSLTPGQVLDGTLQIESKLGRGGMGETWKTYDQTAERHVVLKFVPREMQNLNEAMASVRSSFQKIHALQHQHICPVYNLVNDADHGLYVVMKYIDGLTLSEYRRRLADKRLKLSFSDIIQILWAVAKGLDYAHERKVIHRDIKPSNIMIGKKDGVQVIDFGLAEEIRTLLSQASDTVAMSSSGTRPYMAPEQWQGRVQDARTDQYALAVTAYELLAGHVPFSVSDMELLKNCVLNDSPEPIRDLPDHVNAALLKALSKKRDDRFDSCKNFIKALVAKPETPDFVEISEGTVTLEDLATDQNFVEKGHGVWLPDGFSSSMSVSSNTAGNVNVTRKNMPLWIWPTISALVMLILCLACFLGYLLWDRQTKPGAHIAVKPESVDPSVVETVLEIPEVKPDDDGNSVVEETLGIEEPLPTETPEATSVERTPPPPKVIQPILLTPEPAEVIEARQHYEDAIHQARQPYWDELEKELTTAKQKGELNSVLAFEAELQHLAVEDVTKLTSFQPEKRTLLTLKNSYQKKLDTALTDYQKKLDALVKRLVQEERTDEAKLVQDTLNHITEPEQSETTPKLYPLTSVPVIRFMFELNPDGKGRITIIKTMSTAPYEAKFKGTPFSLSAFPKSQAFRGENGMGRVFFDFRDADPLEMWQNSGWNHSIHSSKIDSERNTYRLSSNTDGSWPHFIIRNLQQLPYRLVFESILTEENNFGFPSMRIYLTTSDGKGGVIDCWAWFGKDDSIHPDGYYTFAGQKDRHPLKLHKTNEETSYWSFQIPEEMVFNYKSGVFTVQKDIAKTQPGLDLLYQLSITLKFDNVYGGSFCLFWQ